VLISLHEQATTTPKIRAAIQASDDPAWLVAERYGISEQTVWKWRKRDSVQDRSHRPHRLQTTLNPAQEAVAVALRKALLLPLDDLLAVVREFLNCRSLDSIRQARPDRRPDANCRIESKLLHIKAGGCGPAAANLRPAP